ncbi:hypothetical protein [Erythrobacter sp.]|uniref:hypothetical protein n=1 Tax=Erythrobacter sp. TaxID=1042 RepID=UPI0025F1CFBA|nr:hypothetical protein [Erythrobacter sp.]
MKRLLAATAAMTFAVTAPAAAQQGGQQGMAPGAPQAATVQPGAVIYGSDGAEIGTVAGEQGDVVVLKVGERNVPIARTAISQGATGPAIAVTRAELVAQFDQQVAAYQAELDAALTQGAAVQTADNQSLGTIESVSGNAVAVQGSDGPMTLPKASLALNDQGKVTVRATMAQVREAMGGQPQSR